MTSKKNIVSIHTVDKKWFEDNIQLGKNSYQMSKLLKCTREEVETYIKKNDLWTLYSQSNISKMPFFLFHNKNIYNALSKYGEMHYSACEETEN